MWSVSHSGVNLLVDSSTQMRAKAAKAGRAKRAANKNRRKADTVLTAMAEDR